MGGRTLRSPRQPRPERTARGTHRPQGSRSGRVEQAGGARRAALDILTGTLGAQPQPLDELFAREPQFARLERRDRAFAQLLVLTVLRRTGEIDAVLEPHLRFAPPDARVLHLLRLGSAQLLFLRTPPHAAVGETVRLASGPLARAAPMLNAVLRKVALTGNSVLSDLDAARLNTPAWLWDSWVEAYGEPLTRAIAAAHQTEPPLDLRPARNGAKWAEALGAEMLPGGALRRPTGGAVEDLPGFAEGAWWVQDVAAGLPATLLGLVAGQRVLDIGAAPGGKTMQLAAMGARVTALDVSPARTERLRTNLERTKLAAELVTADVREWQPDEKFEAVLLDAPCTATGTIRRHPRHPPLQAAPGGAAPG